MNSSIIKKFKLYYNTVKYLKFIQIRYRLIYFVKNKLLKVLNYYPNFKTVPGNFIRINPINSIESELEFKEPNIFKFLNIEHQFVEVDWDFNMYGKLWTYNLNYFNFLSQGSTENHLNKFIELIDDHIDKRPLLINANEPYPASLMVINKIKFITTYNIKRQKFDDALFSQLQLISRNLEFHLLGNHLLENGFALLIGAIYFQNKVMYGLAKQLLSTQLNEQILNDGAHFELSPMYHNLILYRLLDSINFIETNLPNINEKLSDIEIFLKQLRNYASSMLSWLTKISFANGTLPHFNDSIDGISPSVLDLFTYSDRLQIDKTNLPLSDSGYRTLMNNWAEIKIKAGKIGPDYQPGHAHSDSLSFIMNIKQVPFLIDSGISTYEKNERRQVERATSSHNTVQIDKIEQSEIWNGFRVGKRANSFIETDQIQRICAYHDGYMFMGIKHYREIEINSKYIEILDDIGTASGKAYLHFHPNINIKIQEDIVDLGICQIKLKGATSIELCTYYAAFGFNKLVASNKLIINFTGRLNYNLSLL